MVDASDDETFEGAEARFHRTYPDVRGIEDVKAYDHSILTPEQNAAMPLYMYCAMRLETEHPARKLLLDETARELHLTRWKPEFVAELRRRFPHLSEADGLGLYAWALDEWIEAYHRRRVDNGWMLTNER